MGSRNRSHTRGCSRSRTTGNSRTVPVPITPGSRTRNQGNSRGHTPGSETGNPRRSTSAVELGRTRLVNHERARCRTSRPPNRREWPMSANRMTVSRLRRPTPSRTVDARPRASHRRPGARTARRPILIRSHLTTVVEEEPEPPRDLACAQEGSGRASDKATSETPASEVQCVMAVLRKTSPV